MRRNINIYGKNLVTAVNALLYTCTRLYYYVDIIFCDRSVEVWRLKIAAVVYTTRSASYHKRKVTLAPKLHQSIPRVRGAFKMSRILCVRTSTEV